MFTPNGATLDEERSISSDDHVAARSIGDLLADPDQNPLVMLWGGPQGPGCGCSVGDRRSGARGQGRRPSATIAASVETLRAVATTPNERSMTSSVSLERPEPFGYVA